VKNNVSARCRAVPPGFYSVLSSSVKQSGRGLLIDVIPGEYIG
jgi:hypothetical protein